MNLRQRRGKQNFKGAVAVAAAAALYTGKFTSREFAPALALALRWQMKLLMWHNILLLKLFFYFSSLIACVVLTCVINIYQN